MAVPRVAGVGDLAGGDLQRGEQGGGAVADVVVGLPSPAARAAAAGSARSGPAPGSGTSRRSQSTTALSGGFRYSPTTSRTLASSSRVGGELERLRAATAAAPTSARSVATDTFEIPSCSRQQPARPVRHPQLLRRRLQRRQHDRDLVDLRRPARLRPIVQPGDPLGGIPLLPRDHRRLATPRPGARSRSCPTPSAASSTIRARCARPGPQRRRPRPRHQLVTVLGGQLHSHSQRHTP